MCLNLPLFGANSFLSFFLLTIVFLHPQLQTNFRTVMPGFQSLPPLKRIRGYNAFLTEFYCIKYMHQLLGIVINMLLTFTVPNCKYVERVSNVPVSITSLLWTRAKRCHISWLQGMGCINDPTEKLVISYGKCL